MKRLNIGQRAAHTALGIALLMALLAAPQIAQARVGALDPSFGEGGLVATELKPGDTGQLVLAPEGSLLVTGAGAITRYLPTGQLDVSFGEGGHLARRSFAGEQLEGLNLNTGPIALDSQGRIVVFGGANDPSRVFLEPTYLLSAKSSWAVVMRLTPDGKVDTSFGGGKGYIRSDFGIASSFETDIPLVEIARGRVDSSDRPVFTVRSAALTGRCNYSHTAMAADPRAVIRLTSNGSLDTTFGGGDGISPVYGAEWFSDLELDGADQPVVAVPTENCKKGGNRIFRLGSNGEPLPAFGAGGKYYPGLYFSAVEPGGQLILQRGELRAEALARTDSAGNLDPTFGEDGIAPVMMPKGVNRRLQPVGVDAQGRVVLVGSLSLPAARRHRKGKVARHRRKRRPSRSYLVVTRLTADGKTDLSFGKQGWIMTRLAEPQNPQIVQAALDPQGRLVVEVGSNDARQKPGSRVVLARYLLDS